MNVPYKSHGKSNSPSLCQQQIVWEIGNFFATACKKSYQSGQFQMKVVPVMALNKGYLKEKLFFQNMSSFFLLIVRLVDP